MAEQKHKVVWNDCRKCGRSTKHTVLYEKSITHDPDEYHCASVYLFLECNGCEAISFRKEFHDLEQYYQVGPNEWEHPIDVEIFPHFINGHNSIENTHEIPKIVNNIYQESISSIHEGAFTLAGLGLRSTIEAICNDKKIKGSNLKIRINNMNRSGIISKSDAERLHAIRFMGNDAAHEIKKAKQKSVLIALKIIEHILLSVYVFEEEVNSHLEKPITSLEEAMPILVKNLSSMTENSRFTLSKWLGKSKRRILDKIEEIEQKLKEAIENQEIKDVILVDPPENSDDANIQWYQKVKQE